MVTCETKIISKLLFQRLICSSSPIFSNTFSVAEKNFETRQPALIFPTYSRTHVLCARCVRCDVSSDRIALFTLCVMTQQKATFGGLRTSVGGYDPQIRTRSRFLCSAPTPKFHHPVFSRSEVIVLTNTPTNPQTNRRRRKHPTFFATLRRWVTISVFHFTCNHVIRPLVEAK